MSTAPICAVIFLNDLKTMQMNVVIVEEEKIQKILETLMEIKSSGLLKKDDGFQLLEFTWYF